MKILAVDTTTNVLAAGLVENGFVRHHPDDLARELILLHAERSVRIAGARFSPQRDPYRMEDRK